MLRALEVTVPCCSKNSSTENWGISKKISEVEFIFNKVLDPPPPNFIKNSYRCRCFPIDLTIVLVYQLKHIRTAFSGLRSTH